jgi:rod shape-determining protein MreB
MTLGYVMDRGKDRTTEVRGRDTESGLPKSIEVDSQSIGEALLEPAQAIVDAVKSVLERTPPELAADIINEGIVMTGGGSLLHGLNRMIARATGMPVRRAEHPMDAVAIGAGLALEMAEPRFFERELSIEPG